MSEYLPSEPPMAEEMEVEELSSNNESSSLPPTPNLAPRATNPTQQQSQHQPRPSPRVVIPTMQKKRKGEEVAERPAPSRDFSFTNLPASTRTPAAQSVSEALQIARNLVVQATNMATSYTQQSQLLDLIEVFRDFTEQGRINKSGLSALATQVTSLEIVSKTLNKGVKALQKPTTQAQLPKTTLPAPATQNQPQSQTYAAIASQQPPKESSWKTATTTKPPLKTTSTATSRKDKQLVLETPDLSTSNLNPLAMRNSINQAFLEKGINLPVISSVKTSNRGNIVLTTTDKFNGSFLLEHQETLKTCLNFTSSKLIKPWFKVAIHNIPTHLSKEDLQQLKSEIPIFNQGFKDSDLVGEVYWLSSEENRASKRTGSCCIAFTTEEAQKRAIRQRLQVFGENVRVEKLYSTPASTQCRNCQGFGHESNRCYKPAACRLCGKDHPTFQHSCSVCATKGKKCVHLLPCCVHCKGNHTADSKDCSYYPSTSNRGPSTTLSGLQC